MFFHHLNEIDESLSYTLDLGCRILYDIDKPCVIDYKTIMQRIISKGIRHLVLRSKTNRVYDKDLLLKLVKGAHVVEVKKYRSWDLSIIGQPAHYIIELAECPAYDDIITGTICDIVLRDSYIDRMGRSLAALLNRIKCITATISNPAHARYFTKVANMHYVITEDNKIEFQRYFQNNQLNHDAEVTLFAYSSPVALFNSINNLDRIKVDVCNITEGLVDYLSAVTNPIELFCTVDTYYDKKYVAAKIQSILAANKNVRFYSDDRTLRNQISGVIMSYY